ncbi:MAG: two-component regulator propeller domain-containing protein [Flavobacteriales bacterium]|nr:two-component regulator propeller domain-containing protein [Flavobacteriales bacterium]
MQDGQLALYNDTPESHLGHQLFGPHMLGTATRADGLVGVYTRNAGLVYLDGADMVDYTSYNSTFPDNSGNGLVFDSAGDRWLASAATGLIWHFGPYTEPGWTTYGTNAGLPDNTMTCIAIGPDDRKYVGTEIGGLVLFDGPGQWSVLDQANSGLPDDHVRCLLLTDEGTLWAGTNSGGLARLDAALGMTDPPPEAHFTVFPNPFTDRLHVRGTGGHAHGQLRWRMLDPLGATVRSGTAAGPAWSVDAHGLADGMYLLEVRRASSVSYHRLIRD